MNSIELNSLLTGDATGTPTGRVVRALSENGSLSAAQIARVTGLAKSTVSVILGELRGSGLVVESAPLEALLEQAPTLPPKSAGAGRPATMLTLNPEAGTCVGALIGLGEIKVIVADVAHNIIASSVEKMDDDDYTPDQAAKVVRKLIDESYREHALSEAGLLGVGVAVAGPVNPIDGRVQRASVVPTWAGVELKALFSEVTQRPVLADNESNCAALAEMTWGAARGHQDFMLYKVDFGIGGAIVSNGRVLSGVAGAAGEFGHIVIDPDGPLCRCGNRGCLELYASFANNMRLASDRFKRKLTMQDVVQMALEGDVGCRRLITDTATAAGRGMGMLGTILNPPLIVVAGRITTAGDLLLDPLKSSYEQHTLVKSADMPPASRTRIVCGQFPENDSVLGAVGLVLRHHGRP